MTIKNLQPRVIVVPRPSALAEVGEGAAVFLVPGLNRVADSEAAWVAKAVAKRVKKGELEVLDGKADPFSGPVADVVRAIGETYDRATLEALRERDSRPKVRAAIDEQLERLTDHRKAS